METVPYFTGMDGLNACFPWHVLACLVLPTSQVQLMRLRINWNVSSGSKFKPKQCKTLWSNLIMKFLTSDMHNAWGDACQILQVASMHAKLTPGWALNCHWVIFDPIQKIWTSRRWALFYKGRYKTRNRAEPEVIVVQYKQLHPLTHAQFASLNSIQRLSPKKGASDKNLHPIRRILSDAPFW